MKNLSLPTHFSENPNNMKHLKFNVFICAALCAALAGGLFAGCSSGGGDGEAEKPLALNSSEEVEVTDSGYVLTERDKERRADTAMGYFLIMPPASQLLEMADNPDQWAETLQIIDAMGAGEGHFLRYYSDDEMKRIFTFMNDRGIKLTLEGPAVKEWGHETGNRDTMVGNTAEKVFKNQLPVWNRIRENGGVIDSMAFDEPLLNVLLFPINAGDEYKDVRQRERASQYPPEVYEGLFRYAARETAKFMKLVREEIPGIKLGDAEVHWGMLEAEDLIYWIDILNEECEAIGTPRPDFFRLDVNWAIYHIHYEDSLEGWREIKKVEEYCKSIGMPFSLIYWSSDIHFRPDSSHYRGSPNPKWNEYPGGWYDGVMQQGADVAAVGIKPDQVIVETWVTDSEGVWIPYETIPENKEHTFTKSALDLYNAYFR